MIHPTKDRTGCRRGVILLVVLAFLALFAVVGLTFLYYADAAATSARLDRESLSLTRPDAEPELLLSYFLDQLLYDVPDDETGVYSGLRGHGLARNLFGLNYTIVPDGRLLPDRNDVPFNGTGRLPYPFAPLGKNEDELINYTYFPADAFLRDPERPGSRPGLRRAGAPDNRAKFAGGFNAPYTYPDLNSVFLAAVKAGATTTAEGVNLPPGAVLLPSFHRPWLFGPLTDPNNPNWKNQAGKYLLLRPRPADMGPGFPYPEDEGGDVKNLIAGPGYYDGPFTKRLHGNDSVWLDLDFPVMQSPDGRKYKALFAPLIVDLDNRVNLNVHGNLRGLGHVGHASNSGWGAWEVNLGRVLDRDDSEWAALLAGNQHLGGRYGLSRGPQQNHPHSPLPGNQAPAVPRPRFYAPIDFDGSKEKLLGQPTDRRTLPGTPPTPAFSCFPADANGYGNGSAAERQDHPSLYNPLRPTAPDRLLGLAGLEGLLRYGDTGSEALGGELLRLCPKNFRDPADPAGSAKRRGLVTLRSFDLDRPGLRPWFRPGDGGNYIRMQPLSPQPVGGAIAYPNLAELLAPNPAGEFGPDGRAALAWTALQRLDLNRALPDYPNPDASGRITDLAGFRLAQAARQQFAAEIFERLWMVTGAGNPLDPAVLPPPGTPGYSDDRWNALRFLAQLAVNIVDFIDNDDYLTPFNWHPRAGEWVYGTELPRVLVNEAYVEYGNYADDPGLNDKPPKAKVLKANVWVELYNAFRGDPPLTAPYRGGTAVLEMPESTPGKGDPYPVYRVVLARLTGRIRNPDNVTGVPDGLLNMVDRFAPLPGSPSLAGVDTRVILPANPANANGYFGGEGKNEGFYVLGPVLAPKVEVDPFPAPAPGQPFATLRSPRMSYPVPAADPTTGQLPKPSVVLQRLACPYLPPDDRQRTPGPGGRPMLNPFYNPYITVDYLRDVPANYAALVGVNGPAQPPPDTLTERYSVGRLQPYAAHPSQLKPQRPAPAQPDQPRHTFFQHNADLNTPGPNWRTPPALYPPFDWLVHLDRPLVSPGELLHVSAYKPHELTQEFINPGGKLTPFNHRAAWFDEDLAGTNPPLSHRLYRVLEFLEARHETIDLNRLPPTILGERQPGKINLNTVWDEETFQALCDAQPSNGFNPAVVSSVFQQLRKSRTPGDVPGPGDRPLRSLAAGLTSPSDPVLVEAGLKDTLLRTDAKGESLLAVPGARHPAERYELLTKLFNNVTVRSNVFAVWLTVGFFEVTDDTTRPVKLGAEVGRAEGRNVRHRMFAIVDRSVLTANPGPRPRFDPQANPSPGAATGQVVPYFSVIE